MPRTIVVGRWRCRPDARRFLEEVRGLFCDYFRRCRLKYLEFCGV